MRVDQLHIAPQNYWSPPPPSSSQVDFLRRADSNRQSQPSQQQQSRASNLLPQNWNFGPGPSSLPQQEGRQETSSSARPNADFSNYVRKQEVLMQTLLVRIYAPCGSSRTIRAMYDPGSQSSYIKQSLAQELKLQSRGKELVVHQTFGGALSKEMEHPVVEIELSGLAEPYLKRHNLEASVVPKMADNIIAVPNGPWITECGYAGIPLTDVVDVTYDIEILIGNNASPYLKVGMRSALLPSGLVATETRLGWFLEGNIPGSEKKKSTKAMVCINMQITDKEVENYWALETIGIRDAAENRTRAELEEAAMNHFNATVTRDETGRYEVHLPYIEGHPSLPDNKFLVQRRLEKTTKDLVRDGYLHKYHDIFKDWERQGIIEKVPPQQQTTGVVHYLGHRAVFKEGSTTPVRPVFNASGKTKLNPSLNDCLEKGPNLLEIIPFLFSRFRMEEIGVTSDVAKAFLQLTVTLPHRDCLRFLWWEDIKDRKRIVEYRHCRVVFGVSSSPFLLGATIQHLLNESEVAFPETVKVLRSAFYVDNCVASLPTVQEAVKFRKEAEQIFQSAQMDLRGWEFGPSSIETEVPVLGMLWNTGRDTLSYDVRKILKRVDASITRRNVLQLANSLYDPLGLLSPFIIVIKMIFKRICADERKFGWDNELPEEYHKDVINWRNQLESLTSLEIPRYIGSSGDASGWSLHVMGDASKESYACCIFLRIEGSPVRVQLIQAKAKVTPIMKILTIPRAELLACLIAARLYTQVAADIGMAHVPVTFYSDSTTALTWIKRIDAVWGVFVNRRVEETRRLTNVADWKHVPGELNPADLPSRGTTVEKYVKLRWWEGPEWLYRPTSSFPNSIPEADEDAVAREKRKMVISAVVKVENPSFLDGLLRLGDWHKILRVLGQVIRFGKRLKKGRPLSSQDEIKEAEAVLFRHIQRVGFANQSPPENLQPKKDEKGILRVVTRIVQGEEDANFKYPVLLPGSQELVRLLIMKEHSLASHCGVQFLMSILRQKYWIVNSRRSVKAVISKCAICRVHTAKRLKVREAPLPLNRIKTTRCFAVCGVDLAGPLILRDGQKAWIVLFTCAVYRAIHLELVTSLSTEAFLVALRKFVVRRGCPSTIYSDNGTNFVGTANLFNNIDWKEVDRYAAVSKIEWIFNPPTAAWWGGWWERLIGLTKQLLRRVLGRRTVEYGQLEMLVLEVEAVMNERPLTYISEDPADLRPLTPSLFLRDLPVNWLPETEVTAGRLRGCYKHLRNLREQLQTRFRNLY